MGPPGPPSTGPGHRDHFLPRMSRVRGLFGVLIAGSLGYCAYRGYAHWQSIKIFPPPTRQQLREALRAELDGRSGDAERSFHEALTSSTRLTGSTSVLVNRGRSP